MKSHGKDSYLGVADSGDVMRDIGVFCDSIDLDRDIDMADSTTIGSESKEFLPGLDGATITLGGKWDDTVTSGPDAVLAALFTAKVTADFEYGPGGNAAAKVKYSGVCYVKNYKVSTPLEGVVKFSATLQISGGVTRGAFA